MQRRGCLRSIHQYARKVKKTVQHTVGSVAALRVEYPIGGIIRDIGVWGMNFPNLGGQRDKNRVIGVHSDITLIAPSLPPVISAKF